jgi:hypothetical protein
MHPLLLRAEYLSADGQLRFFVLGFEKKRRGINTDGANADGVNTNGISTDSVDTDGIKTNDANADGISTNDINTNAVNTDGISTNGINTDNVNADDVNTNGVNTDSINTKDLNNGSAGTKEKKRSLLSMIKSKINDIKRLRAYKIISNKPLREKLLRWLKDSSIRAVRSISFERLRLRLRAGARDPAALGRMYGYFSAARSALALRSHDVDLSMEPVFTERCLEIDSELEIKTTPSAILWNSAVIAATFPYLRLRKALRKTNNGNQ